MALTFSNFEVYFNQMFMEIKLKRIRILKVCLILVLSFSILPEVVFSQEDIYDKVKVDFTSSERTNSCDEHNCPVLPDEPFHHCAVCCVISHFFTNQLTENVFLLQQYISTLFNN